MTGRRGAAWVDAVAREIESATREVLAWARAQPPELWDQPSILEGWTCKDVLAHLAGDTGKITSRVLRAAALGERLTDPPGFDAIDARNAADIAARAGQTAEELIAEVERDRGEWLELSGRLGDDDEHATWEGFPFALGEYLRLVGPHDRKHLADMQAVVVDERSEG